MISWKYGVHEVSKVKLVIQLRKELKQEKQKRFMAWSSRFLSMDHNADLIMGRHRPFTPLGEDVYEQLLEDLKAAKKEIYLLEFYIIDEGLEVWNSIPRDFRAESEMGLKSNSFMTISAVWQPWLGTIPNDCERWGLMPISLTR